MCRKTFWQKPLLMQRERLISLSCWGGSRVDGKLTWITLSILKLKLSLLEKLICIDLMIHQIISKPSALQLMLVFLVCLGVIFKQALHRMALMLLHWEKHFPAEVLNTVEVMRREMRARRLSPILPKWAFLHNVFLCLSSLTLNYSNCGHLWSNLFRN